MKTGDIILYYITAPIYYLYRALEFVFIKYEGRLLPRLFMTAGVAVNAAHWIRYGPPYKTIPLWANALILVILLMVGYKIVHLVSCLIAIIVNALFFRTANKHIEISERIVSSDPEQMELEDLLRWGREQQSGLKIRKAKIYKN